MRKCKIFFLLLIMGIFLGQAAFGAGSSAEIKEIRVNNTRVDENQTYITRGNLVNIEVYCLNANTIKVGTVSKAVTDSDYSVSDAVYKKSFDDYALKTGLNKLTIQAVGSGGTVKKVININYITSFVKGTEYVSEIPSTGKISVFDKAVNLTFPKDDFIVDDEGDIIENQKIRFEVGDLSPSSYPSKYRTPVSSIIKISPDDSDGEKLTLPGTITIKYDENVPDFSANTITIMYKAGSLGWENIGAIVDSRNKTATAPFKGFGRYGVFNASRFFEDYNWAKPYAEPLWAKGIMQIRDSDGDIIYEDFDEDTGELGLKQNCTRADFASMIVRSLGLLPVNRPGSSSSRFTDIGGSDDRQDIETAAAYSIVEGVKVDEFDPKGSLTRAQAAVIVARVLKLPLVIDKEKIDLELKKVFKDEDDFNDIPEWARPHVLACVKAKYINGITREDGSVVFKAEDNLKRGEAAKLVYLVMKANKRI